MKTERLKKLQGVLLGRPATAKQLARQLKWSPPTVYRGLRQLMQEGAVIQERIHARYIKPTTTGPAPTMYTLIQRAVL